MVNYDGPSFFRKNHSKIKPIHGNEKEKNADKKVSWSDKKTHFENEYKGTLSKNIRTRADLQKEADEYMKTPLNHSKNNREKNKGLRGQNSLEQTVKKSEINARRKSHPFKRKHIPTSLQKLAGWKKTEQNPDLMNELESRLVKKTETYLLFADHLAEDLMVEEPIQSQKEAVQKQSMKSESDIQTEPSKINTPIVKNPGKNIQKRPAKQADKRKKIVRRKQVSNRPSAQKPQIIEGSNASKAQNTLTPTTLDKADIVQEEVTSNLTKPSTGLHRSLSNIMDDDQKALNNGKNNLGSLFSNMNND